MNEWVLVGIVVLGTIVALGGSGVIAGFVRGRKDKTKE